ncbi:lymphotactin-like [Hemicordylus capensis]|uniref:lymphotactin-like n=1 Tax=Hemicordylus capensis TaxID=884348 RepID=UPI00230255CD|nr:lymphotactin-like [Hemicordylus capensis]
MKIYVAAILTISLLELFHIHVAEGSVGYQIRPDSSCIDLASKVINIRTISHYEQQERPLKAVIFVIKNGVRICVPHDLPWVQSHIQKLNKKKKPRQRIQNRTRTTLRPKATAS